MTPMLRDPGQYERLAIEEMGHCTDRGDHRAQVYATLAQAAAYRWLGSVAFPPVKAAEVITCNEPLDSADLVPLRCDKPFGHVATGDDWHARFVRTGAKGGHTLRWQRATTVLETDDGKPDGFWRVLVEDRS